VLLPQPTQSQQARKRAQQQHRRTGLRDCRSRSGWRVDVVEDERVWIVERDTVGQIKHRPTDRKRKRVEAGRTIQAQAALLDLRKAEMRAMQEDYQKRLAEREQAWAAYSSPLWKTPEPSELPAPDDAAAR
jgi:hypothetical protein